jgi:hypothetical protein
MDEDKNIIITTDAQPIDGLDRNIVNFNLTEVETDMYGIKPIIVAKKSTYTEAHRRAQQKYREKYPEKYHASQKNLYTRLKKDEEWKKGYNEKRNNYAKTKRLEKKLKDLENGVEPKRRGKKKVDVIEELLEVPIQNLINQFKEEIIEIVEDKSYSFTEGGEIERPIEDVKVEVRKRGRPRKVIQAIAV